MPPSARLALVLVAVLAAPSVRAQPLPNSGWSDGFSAYLDTFLNTPTGFPFGGTRLALGDGGQIYAFASEVGGVPIPGNIAVWNGRSWRRLGRGFTPTGLSAMVAGPNGALTLATSAGVAHFDGTAWRVFPTTGEPGQTGGAGGAVALAAGPGGTVYAAGRFAGIGGVAASGVARFDGRAWTAVAPSAVRTFYRAVAVAPDGTVFAARALLSEGGGVFPTEVVRLDGAAGARTWTVLAQPAVFTSPVQRRIGDGPVAVDGSGRLCGVGYPIGPNRPLVVCREASGAWTDVVPARLLGTATELVRQADGSLLMLGIYTDGGSDQPFQVSGVVRIPLAGTPTTFRPESGATRLAVDAAGRLATYDQGVATLSDAAGVPQPIGLTTGGEILAPSTNAVPDVYMFRGGTLNRVARWDGVRFEPLPGYINGGAAVATRLRDGRVLVAGAAIALSVSSTAPYPEIVVSTATGWAPFPGDFAVPSFGGIKVLTEAADGALTACGAFDSVNGNAAMAGVAVYRGGAWTPLAVPLGTAVETCRYAPDGSLYVGGRFTSVAGIRANGIARFDGQRWASVGVASLTPDAANTGGGVNGLVRALLVDRAGGVWAGGELNAAGSIVTNNLARWNGTAWTAAGSPNGPVYSLAEDGRGHVFAGGLFTQAGGTPTRGVARWDGTAWRALGGGLIDLGTTGALTLAMGPGGLWAGGTFTQAGDSTGAFRVARWTDAAPVTTATDDAPAGADELALSVGPNPARGPVTIRVARAAPGPVRVVLYDALGRAVRVLHDGEAGEALALRLDTERLAPGLYVVRAATAAGATARPLVVVR